MFLRSLSAWLPPLRFVHVLTVVAVAVVAGSLWYSNRLVRQLAEDEVERVLLYREVLKFMATHDNSETEFLFNNIVRDGATGTLITVPAILTDSLYNPIGDNLKFEAQLSQQERAARVLAELKAMRDDEDFEPIKVQYAPNQYQYIFYRESDTLRHLRYYPYITLVVVGIVLLGAFFSFYSEQRNRQNKVWAGLAKETAHQLGTPISGLMAWVEILKLKLESDEDKLLAHEMERDVQHLQNIAERFSKVGSEPEIDYHPFVAVLQKSAEYVRTRLGRSGKVNLVLDLKLDPAFEAPVNPILFEWVIENLLKNALDALGGQAGTIVLRAEQKGAKVIVEVEDTGKGIPQQYLRDVFKPGFTTKRRGWGLGLSLSRRIVENYHMGKISVKRSEVGKGTTFRIVIPAYARRMPRMENVDLSLDAGVNDAR
jgi:signal transduction histidine kinase